MNFLKLPFRAWYYFRQGWATYFAFLLAATNTLTVTYYLAIEKAPILKDIFPSFLFYVFFIVSVGVPLLVFVGYLHYKKSPSYTSEADVTVESYPYYYKLTPGFDKEVVFPLYFMMIKLMKKYSNDEKFSEKEIKELNSLEEKIDHLVKGGMIGNFRKRENSV